MLYALVAFDYPHDTPFKIRFVWANGTWSDYDYTEDLHDLCYMLLDRAEFIYHSYRSDFGDYSEQHFINPAYLYDRRVVENLRI